MVMVIRHYRDLIAWQRAIDVVQLVYEVSASCPKEEIYGIVSQMRRSAISRAVQLHFADAVITGGWLLTAGY